MPFVVAFFVGLLLSMPVGAEPLVEGQVRLSSGEPAAQAQVLVFDLTALERGPVAQATTDGAGHFALRLSSLGGLGRPEGFALGQNYPNPFNPSTVIPYQLATAGRVRLEVFNVLGQRVATLVDGDRSAGVHTAVWDATDESGRAVGAGVYIYRLRGGAHRGRVGWCWWMVRRGARRRARGARRLARRFMRPLSRPGGPMVWWFRARASCPTWMRLFLWGRDWVRWNWWLSRWPLGRGARR